MESATGTRMPDLGGQLPTGVSIAARVTLAAHALNNEGSRNNALIARQIDVVHGAEIIQTNAISGDSLKHTFVDHLRRLALEQDDGSLPLCTACTAGDPNRLNNDPRFQTLAKQGSKEFGNAAVVDELVRRCVIDDVAGLLVTQGNRNAPRRSTAQFGWEIGVPELVRTESYMHLKLVPADPNASGEEGSNLGQNLFRRPASSGSYALVAQLDLTRIGLNDISLKQVLNDADRGSRQAAAIEALYWTVALPEGAQRNTQLPHVIAITGAVGVSTSTLPPVLYSPLAEDYRDQMEKIAAAFGRLNRDQFIVPFESAAGLGEILAGLAGRVRPSEQAIEG